MDIKGKVVNKNNDLFEDIVEFGLDHIIGIFIILCILILTISGIYYYNKYYVLSIDTYNITLSNIGTNNIQRWSKLHQEGFKYPVNAERLAFIDERSNPGNCQTTYITSLDSKGHTTLKPIIVCVIEKYYKWLVDGFESFKVITNKSNSSEKFVKESNLPKCNTSKLEIGCVINNISYQYFINFNSIQCPVSEEIWDKIIKNKIYNLNIEHNATFSTCNIQLGDK